MLGVVGLIVPEVFTFPFFKKGVAVYDNFFQVPDLHILVLTQFQYTDVFSAQ